MPLPLFLLGTGIAVAAYEQIASKKGKALKEQSIEKVEKANNKLLAVQKSQKEIFKKVERKMQLSNETIDAIEDIKIEISKNFQGFSNVIEKIQKRPEFKTHSNTTAKFSQFDYAKDLMNISLIDVNSFITESNKPLFLASVMQWGTFELFDGSITESRASKLTQEADEMCKKVKENEMKMNLVCNYLDHFQCITKRYLDTLIQLRDQYLLVFEPVKYAVNCLNKSSWETFTPEEQSLMKKSIILVNLQYQMCKISLLSEECDEHGFNRINQTEINNVLRLSEKTLEEIGNP